MNVSNCFSNNTIDYLNCFREILEEMIRGMTSVHPTESISDTFIAQMIPHHMAAIEMSRSLLRYTTYIPLQEIALNIISSQTQSIQDMQCAAPACRCLCDTPGALYAYLRCYDKITADMFTEMENARPANNINVSFMREMIPHHRGAVRMSENALAYDICPELKPILHAIITSQKRGIRQMEALLRQTPSNGC